MDVTFEIHPMRIVRRHASGAVEWRCRVCARQLLVFPPGATLRHLELTAGNTRAAHICLDPATVFGPPLPHVAVGPERRN